MPKKQEDLPAIEGEGVAQKKVPSIEKAADKYVEIRDKRMDLTEKEIDSRAVLIAAMHEAGVTTYVYDDYKITLAPGKEKVKVRTVDVEAEEDEDDDE